MPSAPCEKGVEDEEGVTEVMEGDVMVGVK